MFLKYAVETFYQHVQETLDFNYLNFDAKDGTSTRKWWFYNPTNLFENELAKRLAYTKYEDRDEEYVSSFWSRAHLDPVPYQARQQAGILRDTSIGMGNGYRAKVLKCPMSVAFFSNSPDYLETFEELFLIFHDRTIALKSEYQLPYNFQNLGVVHSVNIPSKSITLDFVVDEVLIGEKVTIQMSATENVSLTVKSYTSSSTQTTLVMQENVTSNMVDKEIYRDKGSTTCLANIFMTDIIFSGLEKLDTQSRGELIFLNLSFNLDYPVVYHEQNNKIITQIGLRSKTTNTFPDPTQANPDAPYDTTIIE